MTDSEYGPFAEEREARATQAAAKIRAAYDAHPGVGASFPEALEVMTDACAECSVALGAYDLSFLRGVSQGESTDAVRLAGIIHRAYEAGKAAAETGAAVEWGIRFPAGRPEERVRNCGSEDGEKVARLLLPDYQRVYGDKAKAVLVYREIGPWKEAQDNG